MRAAFFLSAIGVLAGLHYFVWTRLVRAPRLPRSWRRVSTGVLLALGVSIPSTLAFFRHASAPFERALTWVAMTWLGMLFLLFVLLLTTEVIRGGIGVARRIAGTGPTSPERRQWLARLLAGGTLVSASGLAALGVRGATGPIAVRRVEIPLGRLHADHDGISLAQITDLHVGPTTRRARVADVVARTNAIGADLIVITGDLVDGSVPELREHVAPLGELRAPLGVYFVTGNHGYFSGAPAWVAELERLGIRVLRNERVPIAVGGDVAFELAGTDDRGGGRYADQGGGEDLDRALGDRDRTRPVVLLAHQPRTVLDAAAYGVDLQISGHTHGGQIWPFGFLVRLQQGFLAGLARHRDTLLYVSKGTGYWGPPMRLGAEAEIAHLVLRAGTPAPPKTT